MRVEESAGDRPQWMDPIGIDYRGQHLREIPPNGQGLPARGHRGEVIDDSDQGLAAGQCTWRLGDPAVDGYVAASDSRRDGQAAGS